MASYGSSFFPSLFSWPACFAKEGKNSVHNLPYGPRTRLIRGIYFIYKDGLKVSELEFGKFESVFSGNENVVTFHKSLK